MDGGTGLDVSVAPSLSASIVDLDVEVNDVAGILNTQHARLVDATITMLNDDRLWSGEGMTSPKHWLAWRVGVSSATAAAVVTIAQRADDLPETIASFRRGELSLDQTAAIARKAPWWCDEQARDYGRSMTVQQLRTILGSYPYPELDDEGREIRTSQADDDGDVADTTTTADPEPDVAPSSHPIDNTQPIVADEWCSFTVDDNGMLRLGAGLHAETGDVVQRALDSARNHLFNNGLTAINTVDALRFMAEQSLDAEPDQRGRTRYNTSVCIDVTDGTAVDTAGWQIPDAIRRYVTCDGLLTPTFVENGLPVTVGRSRYVVPQRTRTVVEHRDRGRCRVPGCDARIGLEVHHIVHWEHDGPTDTWNLMLICGKHHRMHHRGRLGITGNADEPDGLEFRNERRRIITPSGADPNPPTGPPPRPADPYEHPDGGRLDKRWVYFRPPHLHIDELRERSTSDADYLHSLAPPWMN